MLCYMLCSSHLPIPPPFHHSFCLLLNYLFRFNKNAKKEATTNYYFFMVILLRILQKRQNVLKFLPYPPASLPHTFWSSSSFSPSSSSATLCTSEWMYMLQCPCKVTKRCVNGCVKEFCSYLGASYNGLVVKTLKSHPVSLN